MHRPRTLLPVVFVILLILTAGCTDSGGDGSGGGPEAVMTPTGTPSQTATPVPTATFTETLTPVATPTSTAPNGGLEGSSGSRPGDTQDSLVRQFSWSYRDGSGSLELTVPTSMYDYYANRTRIIDHTRWGSYVMDPHDDDSLSSIASKLETDAASAGFSDRETVDYAIAFVQSMQYVPDNVSTPFDEYPKYPIETLVERGGDCEDTSILMASILSEMGYGVVLIVLPGHVGVGVKGTDLPGHYYEYDGERYYYLETTGEGWGVGELPEEYQGEQAEILPLRAEPVLVHSWEAEDTGEGQVKAVVDLENLGSAPAEEMQVEVALDAPPEDRIWSRDLSDPVTLPSGGTATYTAYLDLPQRGSETRVRVRLILDGYIVDQSAGNWVTVQ